MSVDGQSAKVPVLVQPGSDLECLLGMSVILGIQIIRANGQPARVELHNDGDGMVLSLIILFL